MHEDQLQEERRGRGEKGVEQEGKDSFASETVCQSTIKNSNKFLYKYMIIILYLCEGQVTW